jgi:hypothetical protein
MLSSLHPDRLRALEPIGGGHQLERHKVPSDNRDGVPVVQGKEAGSKARERTDVRDRRRAHGPATGGH